jgi:hypothetical protein
MENVNTRAATATSLKMQKPRPCTTSSQRHLHGPGLGGVMNHQHPHVAVPVGEQQTGGEPFDLAAIGAQAGQNDQKM